MRFALSLILLGLAAVPARADFSMTLYEHVHNTKTGAAKTERSTITVTGTKIHYVRTYEGPDPDKPKNKGVDNTGTLTAPDKLTAALAAYDKTPVTPKLPAVDPKLDDETDCLTRGKVTRCESARGDDKTPGYKALIEIALIVLDEVETHAK